ncbi:hypothetical protein Tdes44962_MAKER05179 [Teratosphaeria destructans]|uniref:Uncharacterized protein n=1 Tax=Teratosphaeria destructans TaxID=418781 RepID=A0A9W7SKC9_9PEZI|nr:hypothetical protein Tdes44962_MAKER05179 [Teratosphaeria destructans]
MGPTVLRPCNDGRPEQSDDHKAPETAIDQFLLTAVTGRAGGKKDETTDGTRKIAPNALIAKPSVAGRRQSPQWIAAPLIFAIISDPRGLR